MKQNSDGVVFGGHRSAVANVNPRSSSSSSMDTNSQIVNSLSSSCSSASAIEKTSLIVAQSEASIAIESTSEQPVVADSSTEKKNYTFNFTFN